jgi:hypothetical protein
MDLHDAIPYLTLLVTIGFWALVAWGLWSIAKGRGKPVEQRTPEEHLVWLLERGEIDQHEYEDRLAILHGKPR